MSLIEFIRTTATSPSPSAVKLRFLAVGGLNTAFGLAVYPTLMWLMAPLHVHYMIPLIMSFPLAITFSFLTTKFLTFRTAKNYFAEFKKFSTFYITNIVVNLAALPMLVEFLHWNPVIAQFLFAFIVIVTSYFWHSRITFARPKTAEPPHE